MPIISEALKAVNDRIFEATRRSCRPLGSVKLVAVTKAVSASMINEAILAGQRVFGENYVKDAVEKIITLRGIVESGSFEFEFIGHLQRNKVKEVVGVFSVIQSVDRKSLVDVLVAECKKKDLTQKVYVQVNISNEGTKSGVAVAEVEDLSRYILSFPELKLEGLMAIGAPLEVDSPEGIQQKRLEFRKMRELRDRIQSRLNLQSLELSMGMSDDFELAIEEGSTVVRIGSSIFGERS